MSRGMRESHWLVMRRCLAIIRRAQRGPTGWYGLVEAVLAEVGEDAYGRTEDQLLHKRLHHDLRQIRQSLQIDLRADPRTKEYTLWDVELPLLDLPDEDLATLAWLGQTFQANSPKAKEVQALLARLQFYLSPARRLHVEQQRTALALDLGQRDDDKIRPEVETGLSQALATRRRVEFDYYSPQHADDRPRRHVTDIFERYYFDPTLGHYYVRGWCHSIQEPTGQVYQANHYIAYRLGRMSNLQLLPNKLPPTPPLARRYKVEYWLAPRVARQGVTQRRWIDFSQVERHADGSATVHGTTDDLFFALQELMHYRDNCRVLGGPELLAEMRETVRKMAELYEQAGGDEIKN